MALPTREHWLEQAAGELAVALPPLPPLKLSFGWPKGGRKLIGQCFHVKASADGETAHIFVSPKLVEPVEVLAVLLHELVHAAVGVDAKHRGEFVRVARKVGLEPPWTATTAGAELRVKLAALAERLGPLPHVGMAVPAKKQTTRMRLWECACGVKIRRAGALNARCLDCGSLFVKRESV